MKLLSLSLIALLFALAGCGSSPLAPTQSAIALEKSFTAAVKIAEARPIQDQIKLAPYVHEGAKILGELADKTEGYKKPLTLADFGDVAARIAPDIAELLAKPSPTSRPTAPPALPPTPAPTDFPSLGATQP